jgi:rod shape-determining protein MreC
MFSKKTLLIVGIIILIAVNVTILSISGKRRNSSYESGQVTIFLVAPFQEAITRSIRTVRDIWRHYFFLVAVAKENEALKKELSIAREKNRQLAEIELSNHRLRNLLNFQRNVTNRVLAAEVIGKDPSPWFKTIIIDKGSFDGVEKGLPVMIPEGIVGQVIEVSSRQAKVLLMIDANSAVDALVQRTRSRGLIKGTLGGRCLFKYVLRKHDIRIGDTVISSGLDGVYPKGLQIGTVSGVVRRNAGIFQEVTVTPYVDFEKIEEVLVAINPTHQEFLSER